jgi:serine/threonine-protein kinase HipA
MTSEQGAYVWIWLPEAEEPVVCGRVDQRAGRVIFGYGRSYLDRDDAIAVYDPELPLRSGPIEPAVGFSIANCLLDAGPDSWGRRVILNRLLGAGAAADTGELTDLTYLLHAGSERIGALDFQPSATDYAARTYRPPTLEDLARTVELIQAGEPVPAELADALNAGSSAGGARPKALLRDGDRPVIAKFSSLTDTYPVVRGEFLAMRMAALCGLDVAPVQLAQAGGKDVLLVERFDRVPGTRKRRALVSALTILEVPEMAPREASYGKLAEVIRARFSQPRATLRELFSRVVFNVICGNTDDHARNHAAFWDGAVLTLTPAYDICPYLRGGGEATQAMSIGRPSDPYRYSQLAGCVERAAVYGLTRSDAREIAEQQLTAVGRHWDETCDEARLGSADRERFRRVFPHRYALEGFTSSLRT